jgi:RimJ/RimL family protein N-acetyltransferase
MGGEMTTWEYQTERALIVPYVPSIPSTTFPEDFLVQLYYMTKKDDLFRRAFPGGSKFSLNWFISYFGQRSLLIGMIKPKEVAGYAWLYEIEGNDQFKKASVGVCFFKKYWGMVPQLELARLGIAWFFHEAKINIMFGTIASWNRASVRYARLLGFEMIGRAPSFFLQNDLSVDIDLMYLKREKFFGRSS